MGIPPTYRTPHGLSDQLRTLIVGERSLVLGTINPDGSPHLTMVLFSLVDGDKVHIPTPHSTRKIKNIQDRPTVTALWTAGDGWVSCTGTATVVEGPNAQHHNAAVRDRLLTESGHATLGRFLAAHEDTTIEITPTTWLSWQFEPIVSWFDENGIDLDEHPGPSMKDL
ncbi:MAG: pyridoxamine 5'-phosphate oxidase family protein [Acidimicrobiia bacterium]|nr:pyridoxamine 5'-phosphate oxidase family protein [Acidimicrobiia bacterium]